MKRIKLLMPIVGLTTLATISMPLTSCGNNGASTVLVTSVTLSDSDLTIGKGDTATLTATVAPSNATNKTLKWTSSNEKVATVNNGVVTGVSTGECTITATSTDGSNKSATASITIKVISVTDIILTPNDDYVSVNNETNITATILPTNASNKALTWKSSDTTVATVTDGVVKGVKAGNAKITATAADESGVSASVDIQVKNVEISGISFTQSTYSVKIGNSITLTPTYTPSNASNKSISSWTSSDPSVASVSNGVVQGIKQGTTTITAKTSNSKTATATVTVKEASETETQASITASGTYDSDYESTNSSTNSVCISNSAKVTLNGSTVTKSGDSDGGDDDSFYGYNSAILAKGKANVTLDGVTVNSTAKGGNAVFCYGGSISNGSNGNGDGTTITANNCNVTTTKGNAGGFMTTGGGISYINNCTANTAGTSSAAIRTDKGGGTVTVDGGTYKTTGAGSPSIYSTAAVTVKNATLTTTQSEGVVVEGGNSVSLTGCTLTGNNSKLNGESTTYKNIFLYQSMSGDASSGASSFTSKNGKIYTTYGDNFYVTNTTCTITLENNQIVNSYSGDWYFLRAEAAAWGKSGSNGGKVTLNANNQSMVGDIYVDNISTLAMTMTGTSSYTGTINASKNTAGCTLSLASTSSMYLTGNCYLTSFTNADSTNSNITTNGYGIYVYSNGNWVQKV